MGDSIPGRELLQKPKKGWHNAGEENWRGWENI